MLWKHLFDFVVDRSVSISDMRGTQAISNRELSPVRLPVREQTPLKGAHITIAPVYVGEGRCKNISVGTNGPMRRDAPYGIAGKSVTPGRVRYRSFFPFKPVVIVVEEGTELKLPVFRHATDIHPIASVKGALLRFEVGTSVGIDLDSPMVPGIFSYLR